MQLLFSACMVLLCVGSLVWGSVLNHTQSVYTAAGILTLESHRAIPTTSDQGHASVQLEETRNGTVLPGEYQCVVIPTLIPDSDNDAFDLILQVTQEQGASAEFSGTLQLVPDQVAAFQHSSLAIQAVSVQSDMNADQDKVTILSDLEFRVDEADVDFGHSKGQLLTIEIDPGAMGFGSYTLSSEDGILRLNQGDTQTIKIAPHTLVVRASMDVNADGVIDEIDQTLFTDAALVGADVADLNQDGLVDDIDTALMFEAAGHDVLELVLDDVYDGSSGLDSGSIRGEGAKDVTADSGTRLEENGHIAEPSDGAPIPNPGGVDGVLVPNRPIGKVQLDEPELLPPRIVSVGPNPSDWVVDQNGIAEIVVRFSKPVLLPSSGGFYLWSATGSELIPVTHDFTQSTKVLRLTPLEPLRNDRYTLVIDYSVQGTTGLSLDGEVAAPQNPTFPTGDGQQGGQAVFGFTVHQGDVNRDGVIDSLDGDILLTQSGMSSGDPGFDPRADLNADGRVDFLDVAIYELNLGSELVEQDGNPLRVTARSPDPNSPYVANSLSTVTVNFDLPAKACSIRPSSLYATLPDGSLQPADCVTTTNAQTAILFGFNPPLPSDSVYELHLSNAFADLSGEFVESDGQLGWSVTVAPPPPTRDTDSALIMGRVIDAITGLPLRNAFVTHHYFDGYQEGDPPLPGIAFTDIDGNFVLETVEFEGVEKFLIDIDGPAFTGVGYAENLRVVEVMAGRCEQVREATLNALNPQKMFMADQGGMLEDEMDGDMVQLTIPPGALREDSEISMTILSSPDAIRDRLPTLVSGAGMFIDIAGVFGDETDMPVTLRVPNLYNLPLGTRVRFGKISHVTAEWTDLQTPFGAPMPDDPDEGVGIVVADGQGGTVIEVDFTNFCTICTGYCLPVPPVNPPQPPPSTTPPPDGPDVCGSSVVNVREGYLWEVVNLPGFTERGREWGVQLGYASFTAAPSYTISTAVDYQSTRPIERTVYRFQIEGQSAEAFYGRTLNNEKPIGTYFWDGRNGVGNMMPTGSYDYTIDVLSLNSDVPVAISDEYGGEASQVFHGQTYPGLIPVRAETTRGRALLVNHSESSYGSGWSVLQEQRLHFDPDGCIVLVEGNSEGKLFVPDVPGGDVFDSPSGDYSVLTRLPSGQYERSYVDGRVALFGALGNLERLTDRYGYSTTYVHDNQQRLTTVISPVGNVFEFDYDVNGFLSRISDSAGRVTQLSVSPEGRLQSITDALGSQRFFEYDDEARLVGQQGARGERSEYVYDNGRVVEANNYDIGDGPLIRQRQFQPHVLDGEMGQALAAGSGVTIGDPIPPALGMVDRYIDGRGAEATWITNLRGQVLEETNALGESRTYQYSESELLLSSTRADNSRTNYEYNDEGELTGVVQQFNNSSVTITRDGPFQLPTLVVDQLGHPTHIDYNQNGSVKSVTDAEDYTTYLFYEDLRFPDLPTRIVDAENQTTWLEYDGKGNLRVINDPLNRPTVFGYDSAGNNSSVTNAIGHTSTISYDLLNRRVAVTDAENNTSLMSYGDNGCGCSSPNLTRVTVPDGTFIEYEYDGLNRRVSRTDQGGRSEYFEYDAEGAMVLHTRRNGEQLRYVRDPLGRVSTINNHTTGELVSRYEYDVLGNMTAAINSNVSVVRNFDSLSRMTQEVQQVNLPPSPPLFEGDEPMIFPPVTSSIQFGYDLANRIISRSDAMGTEEFRYDDRGLIDEIEFSGSGQIGLVWDFEHDGIGRRAAIEYPNGVTQSYQFDQASQLKLIEVVRDVDQVVLDRFDYSTYTDIGQLQSSTRTLHSGEQVSWAYEYSPAGRLDSAEINELPDGMIAHNQVVTFTSDNRVDEVDGLRQMFDPDGRLILEQLGSGSVREFRYGIDGYLDAVADVDLQSDTTLMESSYVNDALGRRVAVVVNGEASISIYSGNQVVSQSRPYGDGARFVQDTGPYGMPLAGISAGGQSPSYWHHDRVGSLVSVSDEDGDWLQSFGFSPYGKQIRSVGSVGFFSQSGGDVGRFAFLHPRDETGLLSSFRREYQPSIGRFSREDYLGIYADLPSVYWYAKGDPVNYIDPVGEIAFLAPLAKGLGVLVATQVRRNIIAAIVGGVLFPPVRNAINEGAQVCREIADEFLDQLLLDLQDGDQETNASFE